jgi:TonB family protein
MTRGFFLSLAFHSVVVALAAFGLPQLWDPPIVQDSAIPIDVVTIAERTQAPTPAAVPEVAAPEPQPAPEPQVAEAQPPQAAPPPAPEAATPPPPAAVEPPRIEAQEVAVATLTPPEPEPVAVSEPEPEPEPAPEPEPETLEMQPEPEPEPVVVPAPKPKPKRPQLAEAPKPKQPEKKKEKPKPKPEDFTQSVLKTLAKVRKAAPTPAPAQQVANAQDQRMVAPPGERLTISEEDAIRVRVSRYWVFNWGAKGAENLTVELQIKVLEDGTVHDVRVLSSGGTNDPRLMEAFVDSAIRAVRRASPLPIPRNKYALFKDRIVMNFTPKDMGIY